MKTNFWKEHEKLRYLLIVIFFVAGVVLTIVGWKMTGKLAGLGLMIVGLILLLTAMLIYNKPFQSKSSR